MRDIDHNLQILDDETVGDADDARHLLRGSVCSAEIDLGVLADLDIRDDEAWSENQQW